MGFITRMSNAFQAGFNSFRRVYENPALAHQQNNIYLQQGQFNLLWAYYTNSVFDSVEQSWQAYRGRYKLYRNIRPIYNPTRRLVNFYASSIYPGVLSLDGSKLPDGVSLAIPLAEDTDPKLKEAIGQFWQWSNYQSLKSLQVRYAAALGSVLIELVDDLERGKVTAEIVWPGYVVDLNLDAAGNVKSYALQYQVQENVSDKPNQTSQNLQVSYTFRKEVDQQEIRYFKNGQPFPYTVINNKGEKAAVVPNPYGFVPAVWIKHQDQGGYLGSPAIAGSLNKIDELNSLAAHANDQIHKVINAPVIFWSKSKVSKVTGGPDQKRGSTDEFNPLDMDRESLLILQGDENGRVESLAGNLSLSDSMIYIDKLIGEIENDHPELNFWSELRSMSQLTGPAASRVMGDVAGLVVEVAANYDQANISLMRMAVAMSGFRANGGFWGNNLTRQQQKFLDFDLTSYDKGLLDFDIMPRTIIPVTAKEKAEEKQVFWQGVSAANQAGIPLNMVLSDEGWSDEKIAELGQKQIEEIKQQQMLASQDVIPNTTQ